jgi:hypothetical protein
MVFKAESSLGRGLVVFIIHHIKENVTFLFPAVDIMQNTHGHERTSHSILYILHSSGNTQMKFIPPDCTGTY